MVALRLTRHLRWHRCMNNLPRHSNTWYRNVLFIIITLAYKLYFFWLIIKFKKKVVWRLVACGPIMCKLCRTKSEIPAVLLLKVHVFWDVTSRLHFQGHTVDILTLKKKNLQSFLISVSIFQLIWCDMLQDLNPELNSSNIFMESFPDIYFKSPFIFWVTT
jgi:hypothetical protein